MSSHRLVEAGKRFCGKGLGDCLSEGNRFQLLLGLHCASSTSLIQENLDLFWSPPWIVCWGDSSSADRGRFTNATGEGPGIEVAHFVRIGGINSVLGRDKEPVTTALGVKSSHDAQENEVPLA